MKNKKQSLLIAIDVVIFIVIGLLLFYKILPINILCIALLPIIIFSDYRVWKETKKVSTFLSILIKCIYLILLVLVLFKN